MQTPIESFFHYVDSLNLDFNQTPDEFNYDNPVLILVDAVLSMNRKYDSFVVPRVELIRKSGIQTLEQALQIIEDEGIIGFCKVWDYNHPERVEILKRLIIKCIEIKKELKIDDGLIALQIWGKQSTVGDYKKFNVKGFGFTTFQYLRLMCGADTTKPDIHLKRAVKTGTGKNLTLEKVVQIVEETAQKLGIKTRQLDYALWRYYSQRTN